MKIVKKISIIALGLFIMGSPALAQGKALAQDTALITSILQRSANINAVQAALQNKQLTPAEVQKALEVAERSKITWQKVLNSHIMPQKFKNSASTAIQKLESIKRLLNDWLNAHKK